MVRIYTSMAEGGGASLVRSYAISEWEGLVLGVPMQAQRLCGHSQWQPVSGEAWPEAYMGLWKDGAASRWLG